MVFTNVSHHTHSEGPLHSLMMTVECQKEGGAGW